jgi:predicted permease
MNDFRYALRTLRNSPGFTLVVTILLALGIGASCVIFSALDAVMLKRLPVRHPEQLFRIVTNLPQLGKRSYMPRALYRALSDRASQDQASVATDAFGFEEEFAGVTEPGPAEQIRVHLVTPNYFSALGAGTALGRVLAPDEVDTAVLSYGFFEQRFHADPRAIGRTIVLHGHRFTVVGVMAKEFNGISADTAPQVRVPLVALPSFLDAALLATLPALLAADTIEKESELDLSVRLRPGVSIARASGEINSIRRAVAPEDTVTVELEPLEHGTSRLRDRFSGALMFLVGAVGLLLLMVCANVAGLLLARSASRRQEIAIRLALGATRARLVRQMLTESLLLAAAGGVGGVLVALAAIPLLQRAIPPMRDFSSETMPLDLHFRLDLPVLGFSLLLSVATAVLFGLAPALQMSQASGTALGSKLRSTLYDVLRSTRASSSWRGRQALVTFEVALCTVLMAGAGLLVRTFEQLQHLDAGFDRDRVVTFTVNPSLMGYTPQQADSIGRAWIEKARALPGVTSVAVASLGVMRGSGMKMTVGVAGQRITPADPLNTSMNSVSPEYFDTMGMRIVAGRGFTETDRPPDNFAAVPAVPAVPTDQRRPSRVIVNEAFARRFFHGENPIGKLVGGAPSQGVVKAGMQIVGVVSDAKYRSLREPVPPTMYSFRSRASDNRFILHIRTANRPDAIINPVREALRSIDPQLPIVEIHTLAEEVSASLWSERLVATLATIFGALAALLTAVGLYGLLAYAVAQRTREIGIRMALGARLSDISHTIGGQALAMVACGLIVGIAAAFLAAPAVRSLLYGIAPHDALTLCLTVVFLLVIAVAATVVPILRALRIDPATALRQE